MAIKKLLIAVPCYDVMRAEFVQSLLRLMSRLNREHMWFEVKIISGTVVHTARDNLAKHAVCNGFSHVLWLDDDMVFEDSILEDLTISGKTDQIICGRFVSRHNPYLPTIFKRLDPQADRYDEDHIPEDTFQIAACGFACVLTPVQALGDVMNNNHGTCFLPTNRASEDLAFCQRATGLGYEIWCEPTARVGHIGAVAIWPEDGKRFRGDIQGLEGKTLN
jgi:hypothetical protein